MQKHYNLENNEQKYYKIIGDGLPFIGLIGLYGKKYSPEMILYGTTYTAKESSTKYELCIKT